MSQNLTQPEEIDRILMAMGGSEITADTPIPDGAQSGGNVRNSGCGESVMEADFHTAQRRQKHWVTDPVLNRPATNE